MRFWADCDMIHLFIGGTRVKTVRSHLSVTDLAQLVADGAQPAGPPPLPRADPDGAVEVERVVSRAGTVILGGTVVLAAEILAGRQVGIRIEGDTLLFFDLDSRELLRTRPNPLTPDKTSRSARRAARPGPPPRPSAEPIRVQRRVSSTGMSWSAARRSPSAGPTSTRPSPSTSPTPPWPIELDDGETRVIRRTTDHARP